MPSKTVARWTPATAVTAVAVVEFVILASDGQLLLASCVGVLLLVLAWWTSPLRPGTSASHRAAELYRSSTGAVVIYWRPGCWYCSRLRVSLGRTGREAIWVNVWADPAASDFVRGLHRGDEIVPTVLVGDTVLTNPEPAQVRQRLRASRPRTA